MKNLPQNLSLALVVALVVSVSSLLLPTKSDAASAYIVPGQGFITESTFKMSVYVESTTAEPEIASAQIKVTYPANLSVVSVEEGQFDSYLDKSADATTRTISINALNNAGNYKSGKVRVASINFSTAATTGQAQLTVTPDSEINGSGGEQLLTETINGVFTINIPTAVGAPVTTPPATTITPSQSTSSVPATGGNQIALYLAISLGLVALGVISYTNPLKRAE